MTNRELRLSVEQAKQETRKALETVLNALNPGQKQKLLKEEAVKALLDRYMVDCSL